MKKKSKRTIWVIISSFLIFSCLLLIWMGIKGGGLRSLTHVILGSPPEPPARAQIVPIETKIVFLDDRSSENAQFIVCRSKIRIANIGPMPTFLSAITPLINLNGEAISLRTTTNPKIWRGENETVLINVWSQNPPLVESYQNVDSIQEAMSMHLEGSTTSPVHVAENSTIEVFVDFLIETHNMDQKSFTANYILELSDIEPVETDKVECSW